MPQVQLRDGGAYLTEYYNRFICLSGGFGSEVKKWAEAAGVSTEDPITKGSPFKAPLHAPHIVEAVHREYANNFADILTTDTFNANFARQNGNTLLIQDIIGAATNAADRVAKTHWARPLVALSLTSSEDCYSPEKTPDSAVLIEQHKIDVGLLAHYGDFIFAETLPTLREGSIIAKQCEEISKPFFMAFVVDEQGLVLDGSPMIDVVNTILKPNPHCLGVAINCSPIGGAKRAVSELGKIFSQSSGNQLLGKHIGVYPNGFKKSREENNACDGGCTHQHEVFTPGEFANELVDMVHRGATVVGGCCGTTPLHTRTYAEAVRHLSLTF